MQNCRFDDGSPGTPTREWAEAWETNAPAYWLQVLADYRDRVDTYYRDAAEDNPEAFPLMRPTTVRIVVSLVRYWIFAGAS